MNKIFKLSEDGKIISVEEVETIDAQEQVDNCKKTIDRLLKIINQQHLWIFLNTGNEMEVYNKLGLTDCENSIAGYGRFVLEMETNEKN